jgi:dsDNA-binding SOS-regulon protein
MSLYYEMKSIISLFFQELQIIDRSRLKDIFLLFAQSFLYQYHQDTLIRQKGTELAASRIIAFFRMMHIRYFVIPAKIDALLAAVTKKKEEQTLLEKQSILEEEERQREELERKQKVYSIYDSYKISEKELKRMEDAKKPENPIQLINVSSCHGNSIVCKIRFILFPMNFEVQQLIEQQRFPISGKHSSSSSSSKRGLSSFDFKKSFQEDSRQYLYDEWSKLIPVAYRISSSATSSRRNQEKQEKDEIILYLKDSKQAIQEQYNTGKPDFYEEQMRKSRDFRKNSSAADGDNGSRSPSRCQLLPTVCKYPVEMKFTCINNDTREPNVEEASGGFVSTRYSNIIELELTASNLPCVTSYQLSLELSSSLAKDLLCHHREFFRLYSVNSLYSSSVDQEFSSFSTEDDSLSSKRKKDSEIEQLSQFETIICETSNALNYYVNPSSVEKTGIRVEIPSILKTSVIPPSPVDKFFVTVSYYSSYVHSVPVSVPSRSRSSASHTVTEKTKGDVTLPVIEISDYQRIHSNTHWFYELYYDIGPKYHCLQQFSALIRILFPEDCNDKFDSTQYEFQRKFVVYACHSSLASGILANRHQILLESEWEKISEKHSDETNDRNGVSYPLAEISCMFESPIDPLTQQTRGLLNTYDYFISDIFENYPASINHVVSYVSDHLTDILTQPLAAGRSLHELSRFEGLLSTSLSFGMLYRVRVRNSAGISRYSKVDYSQHAVTVGNIYASADDLMKKGKYAPPPTQSISVNTAVSSKENIKQSKKKKIIEANKISEKMKRKNQLVIEQLLLSSSVVEDSLKIADKSEDFSSSSTASIPLFRAGSSPVIQPSLPVESQLSPAVSSPKERLKSSLAEKREVVGKQLDEETDEDPQTKWLRLLHLTSPMNP